MSRVRVTAADFNGRDWDGSPFDPAPAPDWLMVAIKAGDITVSPSHCTDYAVWLVRDAGEAWPGDFIKPNDDGTFSIERLPSNPDDVKGTT